MKRGLVLFGVIVAFAGGCATVDSGNGVPLDVANRPQTKGAPPPPLLVSAHEASSYSTAYLGLVEVTFENRTSVWKQVDHVSVDFGSPARDQSVTIASGEDIDAWERAITINVRRANNPYAATGIEALGVDAGDALGAWASHPRPAPAVASAPAAASTAAPEASAVPTPPPYPAQHLLTTPFRVPPGLSSNRWILLSTPDNPPAGCIDSMIVSYETSDHQTGRVLVPFKSYWSAWQGPACAPPVPTPTPVPSTSM